MYRTILGITADDLTGAADAAAALARPGAPVGVSLEHRPPTAKDERAAFAVTTESRTLPPEEAFDVVADSVSYLRMAGATLIYKKIDSNLRGNIGAELAALFDTAGGPVLLAPAFPARQRTTVNATVLLDSIPIAETEMAHDPESPVLHSHLLQLLPLQRPELQVVHCPLSAVRAGTQAIRQHFRPEAVVVADAETEADLDALAEAALASPPLRTVAGSAGMAAALARQLYGPAIPFSLPKERIGPVLAVLASSSPQMSEQVAQAKAAGITVVPFPCDKLTWSEQPIPQLNAAINAAVTALQNGKDTLLHATGALPQVERPVDLIVEHMTHLAFVAIRQVGPRALLVGGGSTAQAVLGVIGTKAIEIDDEPQPGIAAGIIAGGEMGGLPVVLKPGAAGDAAAVTALFDYLGRRATAPETFDEQ